MGWALGHMEGAEATLAVWGCIAGERFGDGYQGEKWSSTNSVLHINMC